MSLVSRSWSSYPTKDVSADDVEDVIICSVVPKIMYSLTSGVKRNILTVIR